MIKLTMLNFLPLIFYCSYNPMCWKTHCAGVPFLSVVEYYWRDYHGFVPKDAVPGGIYNLTNTFIGQFSVRSTYRSNETALDTLPAVIYKGQMLAESTYRGVTIYSNDRSNLKVLCSRHISNYRWIPTTNQLYPGCQAVFGGFEDEIVLYIGKTIYNGEELIGKIFSDTTHHTWKLITAYKGKEIVHDKSSILIYCDPSAEDINNLQTLVDVRFQD